MGLGPGNIDFLGETTSSRQANAIWGSGQCSKLKPQILLEINRKLYVYCTRT
jgi:hypothetical protein